MWGFKRGCVNGDFNLSRWSNHIETRNEVWIQQFNSSIHWKDLMDRERALGLRK